MLPKLKTNYQQELLIPGNSQQEAQQITTALEIIAQNVTPDNIEVLKKAALKKSVNKTIQKYKGFL